MRAITILISTLAFCTSLFAQTNDSIITKGLDEIEITASIKPSTSQSSTPLQVVTADDIMKQGILSVGDAVKRFNGIVLKDYGGIGGLKTVSIRGMGAEYTTVSYDGVVVNNMQSGQVDIGRFSLDNVSMLSLSIGQSDDIFLPAKAFASAGVLNLQTKRPRFENKNFNIHSKVITGSFGHFEPMFDYTQKLSNKVIIGTNISWQRADGRYPFEQKDDNQMNHRKRTNSDTNILRTEVNLFTKLSSKDNLDIKLYYLDSERGLPGNVRLYNYDKNERLWNKNFFSQITYNKVFSNKWKLKSQAKYDYTFDKFKSVASIGGGSTKDLFDNYRQHEVLWTNTALYQITNVWSASIAQDLNYNSLRSKFSGFDSAKTEPNRYSSFSSLASQYKTDRFTITANLLNTYVHEKAANKKDNHTYKKLTPSLSASVKPFTHTNLRIRASYKHIYRIPTFMELYYVSTSKTLKPESSQQYNIGATWIGNINNTPIEYINLSIDAYYNDVKDKIIIEPTPFIPVTINKGKVEMKGLDAKASTLVRISDKISTEISGVYSYMHAYNASKKEQTHKGQLRYTPKHSGSATLTINNPWANLSYTVIASGTRYSTEENTKANKLESYTEHSVNIFKELTIKKYKVYANGSINNLLNKNYSIIAYYPMAGRSFKVSVGCKF